ncbi:hypothetical protein [Thalassomonas actiniarum]|uniref:Chalcone isomerase domain-containing protein n=1 Tax=Thalassomonas actiniarum TaxID=485447 RepID=A0AAE9YS08_9GAMM|nr:hypothetical protein [Thalassomonas actiniarum]WDD98516.1 hypothetical protein SG35_025220 [Thalassomonas actiniarum]
MKTAKQCKLLILLLCSLITVNQAAAHGLSMTSAEIALRHDKHISLTIRTSLSDLFARMLWPEKPASLLHLASGDNKTLTLFRQQLNHLFTAKMPVYSGKISLDSQRARLPGIQQLRKMLQKEIAGKVLKNHKGKHEHGEQDRQNYLVAYIDGFLLAGDRADNPRELQVQFPTELGDILVSYVEPKVQTLTKGKQHTFYRQLLY